MSAAKKSRSVANPMSRRYFMKSASAVATVAGVPLLPRTALAGELPRISEDDPLAKAVSYVHDASAVDAEKRLPDRFCSNCALFAGGADDEWAGCAIFPGKAVAGPGWCSVWAPKQTQ